MTKKLVLMVGVPASGKSTWIQKEVKYLEEDHYTTIIISRDYIRKSMLKDGDQYFTKEKAVFKEFTRQINEAMKLGIDYVFVDATHINPISRNKILSQLITDPHTDLVLEVLPVKAGTAIKRNRERTGFERVPDEVIYNMIQNFVIPADKEFELYKSKFRNIEINLHREE